MMIFWFQASHSIPIQSFICCLPSRHSLFLPVNKGNSYPSIPGMLSIPRKIPLECHLFSPADLLQVSVGRPEVSTQLPHCYVRQWIHLQQFTFYPATPSGLSSFFFKVLIFNQTQYGPVSIQNILSQSLKTQY